MRSIAVLLLALAALFYAPEARACSCMRLTPSEGFTSSSAVFTGEVTKIEKNKSTPFRGLEVTLKVKKLWKGEPEETVKVHTAGSSAACGYPFQLGKTYLVYAVSDEADPMRVSLCSRTALLDEAKEDLNYLGKPTHTFEKRSGCSVGRTNPLNLAVIIMLALALTGIVRRTT
jgi:hypothetical protein